ncbi:hypothetical protein MRB53_030705 [Persea americana]|uniref:Uncharacterized protein n=1 Tax=Persea americana TaxID=3435 RepID=A0ACC2KMA8_PERAE|nr:hypothetical protein MRB53_030705 [Persea americana]
MASAVSFSTTLHNGHFGLKRRFFGGCPEPVDHFQALLIVGDKSFNFLYIRVSLDSLIILQGTWAKSLTSDLAEGSVICIVGPNLSLSSSTTQTLKREQWKIFQAWDVPEYSIILLMVCRLQGYDAETAIAILVDASVSLKIPALERHQLLHRIHLPVHRQTTDSVR